MGVTLSNKSLIYVSKAEREVRAALDKLQARPDRDLSVEDISKLLDTLRLASDTLRYVVEYEDYYA